MLCAGIAIAAAKITCDRDGGPCFGTNGDDLIQGSAMRDFIHARGGTDGVNAARAATSCSAGGAAIVLAVRPTGTTPLTIWKAVLAATW